MNLLKSKKRVYNKILDKQKKRFNQEKQKFNRQKKLIKGFFIKRQHPIKILGYTSKSFWLLLIPLTRSLVSMSFDIATWLRGWWLDILVIFLVFGYAFLRWYFITFSIEKDHIKTRTGYFGLLESKIYFNEICSISASQGAFYRPFRAFKIFIDTNSGSSSTSDVNLTFKSSDVNKLFDYAKSDKTNKLKFTYIPKRLNVFIFSLLFSSTLSGVILFATLIIQASRIVGRELEERFFFTFNEYMQRFAIKLPRYVVVIALVIILGWLYSFLVNLARHWSFNLTRMDDKYIIQSGIITKRAHILSADKINYVDIQQSFLMKIFNICSVQIHCTGYGKARREIAAIIPIATFSEVESSLKMLMPDVPLPDMKLKPKLRNIMRFLWLPIIICLAIPVVYYVLIYFFPNWNEVIKFVSVIAEIPASWLLFVKIASAYSTGVGFDEHYASLSYCRLYKFHKVIVRKDKISKVTFLQNPIQYFKNNTHIKFYTQGESINCHTVKNFPLDEAVDYLNDNDLTEI